MFKQTPVEADFDDCSSLSSISLSPMSPKSPVQIAITVIKVNQDNNQMNQDHSEWTESEESDESSDSEDPYETRKYSSSILSSSSSSAPSHHSDFESNTATSVSSTNTSPVSITAKSDRADLGILGRRRSGSSPLGHRNPPGQTRKFSSPILTEESNSPRSTFSSSDVSSSSSPDSHSARSPSPLGPGTASKSPPPPPLPKSGSSSTNLLNQRSPSLAMRHEVALRAFRNQRSRNSSPAEASDPASSPSAYSTPSDDEFISPVQLHIPISAPLPVPSQSSDASQQKFNESSAPERPGAQIRHNSSPLPTQRRKSVRPNLPRLITPSPSQFPDGANVEIIQGSFDEEDDHAEQWQDVPDEKIEGNVDESTELKSPQAPSSRAAARKSLFSALGREASNSAATSSSSQVLAKPSSSNKVSSPHRRLPSLDQISSRAKSQSQVQLTPSANLNLSSPAPRGRAAQPVLSTPLPHHRSFSCPTPQTPLHQLFGSVEVFITPPTPRCPSLGRTDATMEVFRSPTNEAFAFVPTGTNERNRITFLETGSPLLTPSWNENGFGFGNLTTNLIPPPFEIAPGRTKKMEEQAKRMMEMMKQQQDIQQQSQSQILHYIPGSPIPPKANEALSLARDQASKYFAPRRRMASAPVGKGRPFNEKGIQNQVVGSKAAGSGSESPNWRARGSNSSLSSSTASSSTSTWSSSSTARKPAGNHLQALEGIKMRERLNQSQTQEDSSSSVKIEIHEASPSPPSTSNGNGRTSPPNAARSAAGKSMLARLGKRKS